MARAGASAPLTAKSDHSWQRLLTLPLNQPTIITATDLMVLSLDTKGRLVAIEMKLANLAANFRRGALSPLLIPLLCETAAEKAKLESLLTRSTSAKPIAQIVPHPDLVQKFGDKIGTLRETLNEETVRTEAAELIESAKIYPDGANGPEGAIVSNVSELAVYALNDNAAPVGRRIKFYGVGCGSRI
jgi:hypothetical protein